MGYYIEVPCNQNKAEQIVNLYGGEIITQPVSFTNIPPDKALICVVDNGLFEAAGYCFSDREFEVFRFDDGRPRKWLFMNLDKAKKLTGYIDYDED